MQASSHRFAQLPKDSHISFLFESSKIDNKIPAGITNVLIRENIQKFIVLLSSSAKSIPWNNSLIKFLLYEDGAEIYKC